MYIGRTMRLLAASVLLASSLALAGCSTSIADLPAAGAPADASAHPKEASGYLPVHDLPPERQEEPMKPDQQAKLQAELAAARDRQAAAAQNSNAK